LSYSQQDFIALKARKFCNSFHLLNGQCSYYESYGRCQHEHGEKLGPKQMAALRAVARQSPCPRGLGCSEVNCLAGHRCTREGCVVANCRFPAEMHGVDTKVVAQNA